jgi:hypothetical protein
MPLRILQVRTLVDSSIVRGLLVIGMYSTFFFGALWLEHVRGFGAIGTGVAFLPMTLTVASLSLGPSTRLMARVGPQRMLLGGLVIAFAALLLLSTADAHTATSRPCSPRWRCSASVSAARCCPLMTIAMSEVPAADAGARLRDPQRVDVDVGRVRARRARLGHRGARPACPATGSRS